MLCQRSVEYTHTHTHEHYNDTMCCMLAKTGDSLRIENSWLSHLAGSRLLVRYGLVCTKGAVFKPVPTPLSVSVQPTSLGLVC